MGPDVPRLDGKVIMITGGNSGIGKASALGLARLGANVVIVCRDRERGEEALSQIKVETGNQDVELLVADLSSLQSVRELADQFRRDHSELHVLVNNAGEILTRRFVTVDGLERTFCSNHLGHFLLTRLLLDTIKASAPARIVNVTSEAHRGAAIHFDDLQGEKKFSSFRAYSQAKLANVLFTYELARRLEGTGVTVNCLHPGVVRTGFGHDTGGLLSLAIWIGSPFFTSANSSAKAVIRLASSPDLETVSGRYFSKVKEAKSSVESYDEGSAKRLWEVSEQLTVRAGN